MKKSSNNDHRLEEAMTNLLTSQTGLQAAIAKLAEQQFDSDKRWLELHKDMDQVVAVLKAVSGTLDRHTKILENLPEAIQKRIGFKE